jgi:hypothetical protein
MDRRTVISTLASVLLATPRAVLAQPTHRVYRGGILSLSSTSDLVGPHPRGPVSALLRGLRELGYVYGEHFVTEPRGSAGKPERFLPLAAELVGRQIDVIVATGAALRALKQVTATVPVVMAATVPGSGLRLSVGVMSSCRPRTGGPTTATDVGYPQHGEREPLAHVPDDDRGQGQARLGEPRRRREPGRVEKPVEHADVRRESTFQMMPTTIGGSTMGAAAPWQ